MTTHTWGTAGTISGLANNQQGNVISQNLATMVQGGAAPTTVTTGFASLAGIWWHDTTNNQVKVRDQADTAWILVGSVDETNKLFTAAASGIAAGALMVFVMSLGYFITPALLGGTETVAFEMLLREVVGDDTVGFEIPFSGSFSATID